MKRLTIGLTATAIITLGVFAFSGCEKEETTSYLEIKPSLASDPAPLENYLSTLEWNNLLFQILESQLIESPNETFVAITFVYPTVQIDTLCNEALYAPCNDEELTNHCDEFETQNTVLCIFPHKIKTKNRKKFEKWIEKEGAKGRLVYVDYKDGYFIGISTKISENDYYNSFQNK